MSDAKADAKAIFLDALECPGREELLLFLDEACGGDPDLRARVEELLRAHQDAGSFLEPRIPGPAATADEAPVNERPGTLIGRYKLLEEIGEGGMGTVWMAQQTEPVKRLVAVKLIKPGMDSKQVLARFEAERQALALMDHPNIARVLDAGTTSAGRPYFVMDLVKGVPITRYCDEHHLTPRQRLELFIPVCQAVQHAHQKGIIHRDVKPSNVMVALYDGKPVPKVIDFGVAKAAGQPLTEKTLVTGFGAIVGTLEYMSPEQAEINQLDIDTRSDIYSLGVLTYELLTGSTPLTHKRMKEAGYGEILRMIKEEEPPRPSTRLSDSGEALASISAQRHMEPAKLTKLVRGELDWIVMKALEKDRNRRYETANGFAADVQRYLSDEPVLACPPSAGYRMRKFVRRNKGPVLAASLVALALLSGIVGTTWGMLRAIVAEADAVNEGKEKQTALVEARDRLFLALVSQARAERSSGRVGQRFEALKSIGKAARIKVTPELRDEAVAALVLPDAQIAREWEGHPQGTLYWTYDATFQRYARMDRKGEITVCRLGTDGEEVVARLPAHGEPLFYGLWLSPDGRFLAYGHSGQREGSPSQVRVWKLDGPKPTVWLDEPAGVNLQALSFHADGRRLAIGHADGTISIYDLQTQSTPRRLTISESPNSLAFHPRNGWLAAACASCVRLLDVDAEKELPPLRDPKVPSWSYGLAWHPDGRILAATSDDCKIHLWDAQTAARVMPPLEGHSNSGISMGFNHKGDRLISAAWDGQSRLWDTATGRLMLTMPGRYGAQFSPDDSMIGVEQTGSKLRLWHLADGRELRVIRRPRADDREAIFAPLLVGDGRVLAAASHKGLAFFDLESGRELAFAGMNNNVARPTSFDPIDGLMTGGKTGTFLWPVRYDSAQRDLLHVGPPRLIGHSVEWVAGTSRDGRIRALPQGTGALVLDRSRPGLRVPLGPQHDVRTCAVSPDGRWVATCSWFWDQRSKSVRIWEAKSGRHVVDLPVEGTSYATFSPDGRWLTTRTSAGSQLWEVNTWRAVRESKNIICWSPDGRLLAVNDDPGVISLVEPESGKEAIRLTGLEAKAYQGGCLTPDGTRLIAGMLDLSVLYVWDLRLIRKQLQELGMEWGVPEFAPAPAADSSRAPLAVNVNPGILRQPMFENDRHAVAAFSLQLEHQPINPEAYLERGLAHGRLNESAKAVADYEMFLAWTAKGDPRRPEIQFRRAFNYHQNLKDGRKAVDALLDAADASPELMPWPERYAWLCNHYAWQVVKPSSLAGAPQVPLRLARKAVELEPHNFMYQNTLGVALYRLGRYEEAVRCLEANARRSGQFAAFDLYFVAMSYERLGERGKARAAFDRASALVADKPGLAPVHRQELAGFRAEAEGLLAISPKKD